MDKDGFIDSTDVKQNKGKWKKGVSGNLNGRPKKAKVNQDKLNEIYKEANGDPILFQKLVLQNGHDLALDLTVALKLAKELAPYEKPRLASIETKEEKTSTFFLIDPTKVDPDKLSTDNTLKIVNEIDKEDL